MPRSPGQGRLCRAPRPHPRQLGSSAAPCSACTLAACSCLSPATAKPAWNIAGRSAPLPEQGGSGCAAGIPPRRGQGGLSETPQPGDALKDALKDVFKGAFKDALKGAFKDAFKDAFKASAAALPSGIFAFGPGFGPAPCGEMSALVWAALASAGMRWDRTEPGAPSQPQGAPSEATRRPWKAP